jgi:hypothetical protein
MNNSYRCGPQSAPQPEMKSLGKTAGENPPRIATDKDGRLANQGLASAEARRAS